MVFCHFANFISFCRKICIDDKKMIIYQIRRYDLCLDDVIDIYTNDRF